MTIFFADDKNLSRMSDGVSKEQKELLISKGKQLRKYAKRVIFDKWSKRLLKAMLNRKKSDLDNENETRDKKDINTNRPTDNENKNDSIAQKQKQTDNQENWNPKKKQSNIEKTSMNDTIRQVEARPKRAQSPSVKRNKKVIFYRNISINTHITRYKDTSSQTKSSSNHYSTMNTQTSKIYLNISPAFVFSKENEKDTQDYMQEYEKESSSDDILKFNDENSNSHIPTTIRKKNQQTEPKEKPENKSILTADADNLFTSGSDEDINLPPIEVAAPALTSPEQNKGQYSVDSPKGSTKKKPNYSVDNEYDSFSNSNNEDLNEEDNEEWISDPDSNQKPSNIEEDVKNSDGEIEIDDEEKGISLKKSAKVHFTFNTSETVNIAPSGSNSSSPIGSPLMTSSSSMPTMRRNPIIMVRRPQSPNFTQLDFSPASSLSSDFSSDPEEKSDNKNFELISAKTEKPKPKEEVKEEPKDKEKDNADVHDSEIPIEILSDSLSDVDIDDLVTPTQNHPTSPTKNGDDQNKEIISDDSIDSTDSQYDSDENVAIPLHEEPVHSGSDPTFNDTQIITSPPLDELLGDIPVTPPKEDSEIRAFLRQFFTAEVFQNCQNRKSLGQSIPLIHIPDTARRPFKYPPDYLDLVIDLVNEIIETEDIVGMFYEQFLDHLEAILGAEPIEMEPNYITSLHAQSEIECDNTGIDILMRIADSILESHTDYVLGYV